MLAALLVTLLVALAASPLAFAQQQSHVDGEGAWHTSASLTWQDWARMQNGVDKEGTWHLGENLMAGDYFSYNMCSSYHNDCSWFNVQMWFSGTVQVGSEEQWLADVVVWDDGVVTTGNMTFAKKYFEATGGSPELAKYAYPIRKSVTSLSVATHAPGTLEEDTKGFDTIWLQAIGPLVSTRVTPFELEDVTVPAGTWEESVVVLWSGVENGKIWIADGFPLPLKADMYSAVYDEPPPQEYALVLVDYDNLPENPLEGIISTADKWQMEWCETDTQRTALLETATYGFRHQVRVSYSPEEPDEGCTMYWGIEFLDSAGETLKRVQFDVTVLDDMGNFARSVAKETGNQFLYAPSGMHTFDLLVKEPAGEAEYTIWIYGLAPDWIVPDSEGFDTLTVPVTILPNDAPAGTGPGTAPIPEWIKSAAGYWADGATDDQTFVSAMQFLIREGVLNVPVTVPAGDSVVGPVPEWIRVTTRDWSGGSAEDYAFVSAMQSLIRNGMMGLG